MTRGRLHRPEHTKGRLLFDKVRPVHARGGLLLDKDRPEHAKDRESCEDKYFFFNCLLETVFMSASTFPCCCFLVHVYPSVIRVISLTIIFRGAIIVRAANIFRDAIIVRAASNGLQILMSN